MIIQNKFLTLTIILCFLSLVSMAKDMPTFSVEVLERSALVLQITDAKEKEIQVTLKDDNGNTIHSETLTSSNLVQQKYNLKELPVGDYFLVVTYGTVIKVQPIKKGYTTLEINAEDLRTIYQPTIKQHSTYLDLNMLCHSNQKISLEIRDSEGHVIYKETIQQKGALQRRFNLFVLDKDLYTFTVSIVDTAINEAFEKIIEWSPNVATL
jgi:hypothetical protein